jgi:hypothetical protein
MITGKNTQKIADVTGGATGAQAGVQFQLGSDVGATYVVSVTVSATYTLEGRISTDAPWVAMDTQQAPAAPADVQRTITRMLPEVRLNIAANGGAIKAWVMA